MTTYTGKNLETALQKAAQATGTPVDALKYEILAGKTGGYALIKVTAAVAAAAAPAAPLVESLSGDPNAPEAERREPRGDRGDRGPRRDDRGGDRGPRRDDRGGDRGPRRDDRGGGDRGPRRDDRGGGDRGPRRDDRGGERHDRGDRGGRGDRPRGRREDREEMPPIPADGPTVVTVEVEGELSPFGRKLEEVLVAVLEKMGFGCKVKLAETADEVIADLQSGPYHDALVAKELELLDALELLLEKTVRLPGEAVEGEGEGHGHTHGKSPRKKIHLDTNGHRAKADLDLAHSARHMAERAIDERRVFKLGPLDPRARRVVHMTLKEVPGVVTKSEGEGVFRRVCIIPKSAEPAPDELHSVPDEHE
ncbi:MAG: hypothetical protein IT385_01515 [Deltaproteobacteria bacterium]|nr:hypothetical protein [Deltaproteobacteria bacterium]